MFVYSGLYHEMVSFLAGSGYGGPTLYFLVQYLGVAAESSGPGRRVLRGRPWLGRAWTLAVVVAPVGLLLHRGFVEGYLVPMLAEAGVPGLPRSSREPCRARLVRLLRQAAHSRGDGLRRSVVFVRLIPERRVRRA